jgi:hypothetical protein
LFVLVGLGFELKALLAKQVLLCLSHTSSAFGSGYFGDWGEGGGVSQLFAGIIFKLQSSQCQPSK